MKKSRTHIAIPPGETIKEQLIERGMKQKEFAVRMGVSEKHISKLINGEVQLTIEMARRLEMVLGLPTQFWCNLEAIYREDIAKVHEENTMQADVEISDRMPYEQMAENGWIVDVSNKSERVIHLRKYFEIAELKYLQATLVPRIACRKLSEENKDDCMLIAWVQKARIEARKIETKPVDVEKLKSEIMRIKRWIPLELNKAQPKLMKMLAECGVAIVFLPHMKESFLHGATFGDGNKIVIGLTTDGEEKNEFWFNLFHELAHIIYGHLEKVDGISEADERAADKYAEAQLMN